MADFDMLIVSPGVPVWHPRLIEAKAVGVPVHSELEVGARFTDARLVAVTGTNGKTTTVTLAAHLLGGEAAKVFLAGNVGRAICEVVQRPEAQQPDATLVVEVSSFQCEHLHQFHPDIAVVLNLRPDHFDRHGDMAGYRAAKAQMGKNLTSEDTVIVNLDEPQAREIVTDWQGRLLPFSLESRPSPGVYLEGDLFIHDDGAIRETLMHRADLPLLGRHNVANALAAAAIARQCAVECRDLADRCRTFAGVPHRIEWVANDRGVDYFNDSKATNLDSMSVALASFDRPVVLIAGGKPKGEDYRVMAEAIRQHVRSLVLIGVAAGEMEAAWGGLVPTQRAEDFDDAVRRAQAVARAGDVVLLSPGCASFDMFRDYEDRGDQFRTRVQGLAAVGGGHA